MTQNLASLIQSIRQDAALKASFEAETKKLGYITWHQQYKPAAIAAAWFKYLFAALSAAGSAYWLADVFGAARNAPAAWATALALTALAEWLKGFCISKAAYGYFYGLSHGGKPGGRAAWVCSAVLLAVSFYMSVAGALAFSSSITDKKTEIQAKTAVQADSVRSDIDNDVTELLARIDTLQSLRAKRPDGLLRDSENKQILLFQTMIAAKEAAKADRIAVLAAASGGAVAENEKESNRMIIAASTIAAANDLLLCLCIGFGWAFAYHSAQEDKAMGEALKRAQAPQGTPEETPKEAPAAPEETPTETPKETPMETAPKPSLKKDPEVLSKVAALRGQGLSGRAIAAELKIGKSTVGEMIKENNL